MKRIVRGLGAGFAVLAMLAGSACGGDGDSATWPPLFETVRAGWRPSDARLLDRSGRVLQERRVDPNARRLAWTNLADISPPILEAVLLSEDARFREHGGVDVLALAAAARSALSGGVRRGASTIPMQLSALLRPDIVGRGGDRSWSQKARQLSAGRGLAARWSKNEMLEAYLNLVSFRGELVGVAAAARGLFGKAPHGVDAAEALVLASLLRGPNAAPEVVAQRAAVLAERLAALSVSDTTSVTPAAARVRALDVLARAPRVAPPPALAPHVAARLLRDGATEDVRSTLDADVQRLATAVLRDQLVALSGRNVHDGAVLVVENATGNVLAWVGSSGSLSASPRVDGVRARRQAGSTLKPFLYTLAFEDRLLTPAARIDDSPLDVSTPTGVYRPENYDHRFRGLVPARIALASSLNVPAVRTVQQVGVDRFVERLGALGFEELRRPDHYGESVALGSADVTLFELVNAYRTLARGGVSSPLRLRADHPASEPVRVFTPQASFLTAEILSDRGSRSATFGLESPLATPFYAAVKTGTSKDMRDNWCVGFSSALTVGVWVGNFSGAPMWQVSGVDGAAPAWLGILQALEPTHPSHAPATPDGVVRQGGEWYLAGTEPLSTVAFPEGERPRRIRAPSDGTIVALDPDIPRERQRVFLESDPPDADLHWRLDGQRIGAAGLLALWEPVRGRHQLELVDADGAAVDRIRFEVR